MLQFWLSAFAHCVSFVQAPALSEPPFAHLQNGGESQVKIFRSVREAPGPRQLFSDLGP